MTNANLATASNADADIAAVYSVTGSDLSVVSGIEILVPAGHSFTPGGLLNLGGSLDVDGVIDIGANSVLLAGDLDVAGTFTTSPGSSISMNGNIAQIFNQGAASINTDLTISNTTATVSLNTNDLNLLTNDLTINTGATLALEGLNIDQVTGTFSNDGTLQVNGAETTINLAQDSNSGTWEFVDDGDTIAETISVDGTPFPNSYYNLVINSNDATPANRDTFQTGTTTLTINGDLTITSGTYDTNNLGLTIYGDWLIGTNGLFNGSSSFITLIGDSFTNNAGAGYSAGTSSFNISPNKHGLRHQRNYYFP